MTLGDICDNFALKVMAERHDRHQEELILLEVFRSHFAVAYRKGLLAGTLAAAFHARHPPGRISDAYAEQMAAYARSLERGDHLDGQAFARARETEGVAEAVETKQKTERTASRSEVLVPDSPGWWWRVRNGRMIPTYVFVDDATGLLAFDDDTAVLPDLAWLGPCLGPFVHRREPVQDQRAEEADPSHKTVFELICEEMLHDLGLAHADPKSPNRERADPMINAVATQLSRLYSRTAADDRDLARWFLQRMRARGLDVVAATSVQEREP